MPTPTVLRSLDASTAPDMVGTDGNPTFTLKNTSTGPGLKVDSFLATGNATIGGVISTATITSTATAVQALTLTRNQVGSPSIALLTMAVSGASIPVLELSSSAFTSAVSIVFAAGAGWAGMGGIRVKLSDGVTYGWIPIIPNGQFTAAASS